MMSHRRIHHMLRKKIRFVASILISSALILPIMVSSTQFIDEIDGVRTKDLSVVHRDIAMVGKTQPEPSRQTFNVTAWVDKRNNTYRTGEKLVLSVRPKKDAYITVINVGTTGNINIVYPNKFSGSNFVRAGEILKIPGDNDQYDFVVHGQAGYDVLKVVATSEPVGIIPDDFIHRRSDIYPSVRTKDIRLVPSEIDSSLQYGEQWIDWDEYTKVIRIK